VLCDLTFALDGGEFLLVVGSSGSGKSTLALALGGLVPHELPGEWRGSLALDGADIAADREAARAGFGGRVGLLFQDPDRQLVMERAEDDVAFGLENRGWAPAEMRARVPEALAEVGLAGFERRRPAHLSGGEQQRLALAGVLAPRPGLLVLDEPTANLDPPAADALMRRLADVRAARRTTILLVEHHVELAWPMADRILALAPDGSLLDWGAPDEVLRRSGAAMRAAGTWLPGDRGQAAATDAGKQNGAERDEPVVEAIGVGFEYDGGPPVVDDASLRIRTGERVALVGPNGSGKSTLARLLVGLLEPDRGTVRLAGANPARLPAATLARQAGYVFQDPERQFLGGTVSEEVGLGLKTDELARMDELMSGLGLPLDVFGQQSPYRLSGGEQRRLSLACVLVRRPGLLVLDEPTFGQDRRGHEALLAILRDRVEAGAAVLAASHDRRFVADFAGRVVEMEAGRLVGGAGDARRTP
jgi:energy-coupling factor transport system ATP-binding protein